MTRQLARVRTWRIALGLLVVVVAWFAVVPTPPPALSTGWDKLNHVAAFTALALAGRLGFRNGRAAAMVVAAALLAYGGLIELVQLFVPGRQGEWADLLGDAVGVLVGLSIATALLRTLRGGAPADG